MIISSYNLIENQPRLTVEIRGLDGKMKRLTYPPGWLTHIWNGPGCPISEWIHCRAFQAFNGDGCPKRNLMGYSMWQYSFLPDPSVEIISSLLECGGRTLVLDTPLVLDS